MNKIKIIEPKLLSLITTYQCTSACYNCCFSCSPKQSRIMTLDEMKEYVLQSTQTYPSIKVVVFTGGECSLLGKDLFSIIEYCKSLNLLTRIVSNAHWARTKQKAEKFIDLLTKSGLTEINFSTGTDHQKFVPIQNIVNAVIASCNSSLLNVVVSIETHSMPDFTANDFLKNEEIQHIDKKLINKLFIISSPWVEFKHRHQNIATKGNYNINIENSGCENIFSNININPYGQLLACCGLACEYSPFLKLGNFKNGLKTLYERQFNDVFKLWLYTEGAKKMLYDLGENVNDNLTHDCDYCLQMLSNKECIQKILNIKPEKIKNILLNYNLKIN